MADISWPELIVLTAFGDDGGGLRGTFRVREASEPYDDPDADGAPGSPTPAEPVGG